MANRELSRDSPHTRRGRFSCAACAVVVLGLVLSSTGCREDDDPPTPPQNDDAQAPASVDETSAAQAEAFEKLSSLGYVDYSVEEAAASLKGVVGIDRKRSYVGDNLYSIKVKSGRRRSLDLFHANSVEWIHHEHLDSRSPPNGGMLITNSNFGQMFEVTPKGDIVWEFLSPHLDETGHRAIVVRMKRYERAFVEQILEQCPAAAGSRSA